MLAANVVSGLWLTAYLVKHLGIGAYGLVPLATSITTYMSVINAAINGAVGRFFTIELRKGVVGQANRTFNTALWGSILVSLLILPLVFLFSLSVPNLFDVPDGFETAASLLFASVMIAYLIGIIRGVFLVSPFAFSRFDLQNGVLFSNLVVRIVIVVLLFTNLAASLSYVGLGILAGALVSLFFAVLVWQRLTPDLTTRLRLFDWHRLKELLSMSGWMMVNQVGALLFLNIDLIVVNLYLGAQAAGRYGAILQWPLMLRMLGNTFASVLTPIALGLYAQNEFEKLNRMLQHAVRIMGITMALPVGLVCGLSQPLLSIWLGPDFADMWLVLSILAIHLCINVAIIPLFSVQLAYNKVRIPGLVTISLGFLNLILAVLWVRWFANGIGVALAGAIVLTLKNAIFTPIYAAHIQKLPKLTYIPCLFPGVLGTLAVAAITFWLANYWVLDSWLLLALLTSVVSVGYILVAYLILMGDSERQFVKSLVPDILNSGQ